MRWKGFALMHNGTNIMYLVSHVVRLTFLTATNIWTNFIGIYRAA